MRSDRLVVVFARLPRDERRAKPLVAGARAARVEALHRALLRRTLAAARASGADVRLVTTGVAPPSLVPEGVDVVRQIDGSFAERLERAVADGFADGWRQVVVVGGDTAAIDEAHLTAALDQLSGAPGRRAVLGPASDGGYYLIGLNEFSAAAFDHDALGTREAHRVTAAALAAAGFEISALPRLRDLDAADDVRALAGAPGPLRRLAALLIVDESDWPRARTIARLPRRPRAIRVRGPPVRVPTAL